MSSTLISFVFLVNRKLNNKIILASYPMSILTKSFAYLGKHWKLSLCVVVLLGGAYYYFSPSSQKTATIATVIKNEKVERGDLRVTVSGSGQVEAASQIDLTPVIAGDGIDVMQVLVKNNQEVKKNQVIAVLDTEDAVRDIQNAELDLESAKIKQKQASHQYNNDSKTDSLGRQAQKVAVEQSTNSLNKAKKKLQDYYIKAPFDGIVTGLSVEAGDSVSRDTVLASVITHDMRATITLNEVDAAKVAAGNSAELSFDALPELTLTGKISKIDTIGVTTQNVVSYGAEIEFGEQNASLKPGMSVSAEIAVVEKKNVLTLSNAALTTMNNKTTVRTANGIKEVKIGVTDDVYTEIVGGLSEGDVVLIETGTSVATAKSTKSVFSSVFGGGNRR